MRAVVCYTLALVAACKGAAASSDDPPGEPPTADASPSASTPPDREPPISRDAAATDAAADPDAAVTDAGVLFDGTRAELPAAVRTQMTDVSWHQGCPVGLDDLALLDVPYWDFAGTRQRGQLVVAASVASDVLEAFRTLHDRHFPIAKMRLVDEYAADDDRSMADDNTSAFNCRAITGGSAWSAHSYGTAIDVNPRENPYVKGQTVLPAEGADYLDRSSVRPGMAVAGSALVQAFDALGWGWGGRWSSPIDYQHFSADDR